MAVSIPASQIVSVTPNVIAAGGTALDMVGLIVTNSSRLPNSTLVEFADLPSVQKYFGASSSSAVMAAAYFAGFDNSNVKPSRLRFIRRTTGGSPGSLRGGDMSGVTLTQLQAITGTLVLTVDSGSGSLSFNLGAATSFSDAAAILQTAATTAVVPVTITYDTLSQSFLFTSNTTGLASNVGFASGSGATPLKLTAATGAVLSPGTVTTDVATFMNQVVAQNQNFATFTTAVEFSASDKLGLAGWASQQNNRYLFVNWESALASILSDDPALAGYSINANQLSGTANLYAPDNRYAAFLMGSIASLDFTQLQGRATLAFRSQAGLPTTVTDVTTATTLKTRGYNFYGTYGTANDTFTFLMPGTVSGLFVWVDDYVNQIWMNNAFQLALISMLVALKSLPYNQTGYAYIEAALADPINAAVNFGAIQPGVTLSAFQAAQVNAAAGLAIDQVLSSRGWYLQVLPATPAVRQARGSPPCTFWYTSGGSIQSINLASVQVS